jgi:hypothetical protein
MWKEIPPYHGWYLSDVDALVAVIMREGMWALTPYTL